jgi:hypothetical protein
MKTTRLTTNAPSSTRATARMSWSILDPSTKQCRVVSADEFFPIAGRLLSGVWQLDDGRVLLATSTDDAANDCLDQATVRIEYVDREAAFVARAR